MGRGGEQGVLRPLPQVTVQYSTVQYSTVQYSTVQCSTHLTSAVSRNAGGFYRDLEVVVTSALGCQLGADTHGMRLVRVAR